MNCTSHFVLKNYFNICIQVLRGKFSAEMQDYQVSTPILYGGILHKGSSFLLEAPRPQGRAASGALRCSQSGCRKPMEKLLSLCAGWKAALPSAAGMELEGSDTARNSQRLHGARELWAGNALRAAGRFRAGPLKFFESLLNHLKYCQNLSSPF